MPEAEYFSRLQEHLSQKLPFVAYRKPILTGNRGEVSAFLQEDDKLNIIEDFTESGFVFAPFDTSGESHSLFLKVLLKKLTFEQVIADEASAGNTSQKGEISEEKKSASY